MTDSNNTYNQEGHNHSALYLALGSSMGGGFLLILAFFLVTMRGGIPNFNSASNLTTETTSSQEQSTQNKSSASSSTQKIVPVLVQNKNDLDEALKMYDNQAYASDTSVQEALDENSKDLSSFSN
jgi:hypothetical protein